MADKDREETVKALAVLFEAFRATATEGTYRAYLLGLEDVPVPNLKRAVVDAIKTGKFCPTVAELRELAGVANGQQRAELAFAALDRAIANHGGYRSVSFDDPLINAVVRSLGGWTRVCDMHPEEFAKWYRKEFLATYERMSTLALNDDLIRPLPGIAPSAKITPVRTGLPWAESQAPGLEDLRHQPSGLLELRRVDDA